MFSFSVMSRQKEQNARVHPAGLAVSLHDGCCDALGLFLQAPDDQVEMCQIAFLNLPWGHGSGQLQASIKP